MCYLIYLSTTSQEDLSRLPSPLYRFSPPIERDDPAILHLLDHPTRWYMACQYGGCSCHFRHLNGSSMEDLFPPADWLPEDADDIEATQAVYDLLARLVTEGHQVDLIDSWVGTPPEGIAVLDVPLSAVRRDAFRFLENCKFQLSR